MKQTWLGTAHTAVDPDNRLVARSLERDWNEKITAVEQLHREYATVAKPTALVLTPQERQRILLLAQNVPAVWHAPTTTPAERKQLVRFLIKDVTLTRRETRIEMCIRWRTEALTALTIARPQVVVGNVLPSERVWPSDRSTCPPM